VRELKLPKRKRMSVILTAVAGGLIAHGLATAEFRVGFLGLIDSFPATIFVGLGILTVAAAILWVSKEYHPKLMLTQLVILVSVLWLAPVVVGGSSPFTNHALRSLGLVEYIARTGNMTASELPYLSWPGAFIPFAMMARMFSVDFASVLGYAPFIMWMLFLAPLYIFLRNTLGYERKNYIWAGMWLFSLAGWTGDEYFAGTVGSGLFLLLTLLALVTTPMLWERESKRRPVLLATIVGVYGLLAVTHLLTALIALCVIGGIVLLKRNRRVVLTACLCLSLLIAWNMTGAMGATRLTLSTLDIGGTAEDVPSDIVLPPSSGDGASSPSGDPSSDGETGLPSPSLHAGESIWMEKPASMMIDLPEKHIQLEGRSVIFNPATLVEGQVRTYLAGSESHIAVSSARLGFSVMFVVIGVAGVAVALADKNKKRRHIAILVLVMAVAPLILIFIPYGGRMVVRLYLVSLVPMAYFGAVLWGVRKRVVVVALCLVMAASIPFHFIAHYGNHEYDYISPGHMGGLRSFHDSTSGGSLVALDHPWLMENLESYRYVPFADLWWKDGKVRVPVVDYDKPVYFVITRQDRAFYDFVLGAPEFAGEVERLLGRTENCELVYDNPDFMIWEIDNVKPKLGD